MNAGSRTGRNYRRSRWLSRRRTLRLEALEDRSLLAPLADIVNVSPDPRAMPVGQVVIDFTDSVTGLPTAVTGVDASDFTLTLDNKNVPLLGAPVTGSGDTWAIDLSSYTTVDGAYVLTLKSFESGIKDSSNQELAANAIDSWTIDSTAPVVDIVDISPDPRNTAVGAVSILFNEAVTGVDINDFSLTRNGVGVSLAGLVVSGSGASYTLNLSSVTSLSGTYFLTLHASGSGIQDTNGTALAADASDTWVTDAVAPTATFSAITTPRTTSVGTVAITFSESVTGVDIADFTLTRNGTTVALTGLTVSGSGSSYSLNLTTITATPGTYVLTLVAANSGITDTSGNTLTGNTSATWVTDTTAPIATIVAVTPNPRTTPVGLVTVNFSEAVTGVNSTDFTLTRNGVNISMAGVPLTANATNTSFTLDLSTVTTTVGSYVLTLVASGSGITDTAGNALAANAATSFSIDDAAENNDTLRTATELGRLSGANVYSGLSLIDQNDWYRFTTSLKGTAADSVSISFNNAKGNLDLQLYSVSGQLLKSSTGDGNTETISLSGRPAGTYYIRVYGKAGAINPEYTLTVNAPVVPVEDQFEQNDTRGTASNLGTMVSAATISDLALLDAHDWYRFSTTTAGTAGNSVGISFLNAKGNLDLELYNAAGTKIGSSLGSGNSELISLAGRAAGTYYVHVLGKYGAKNANYSLSINPPSAAAFNFQFQFAGGMKASQVAAFQQAANKWQSVIVGDVPNTTYTPAGGASVAVDDLLIDVAAFSIDGIGNILGGSAPDAFRAVSFLPTHGRILFDSADLAELEADGDLVSAALHELAHVLGFGSIWTDKGLLTGAGTADPRFTGAQAVAAYNSLFGTSETGVPLDNSGIEGTADSHWSEDVLDNELMTGFLNPGVANPLSQITIASMADLGYAVNLAAADPYTKPASMLLAANSGGNNSSQTAIHLSSAAAIDALMANWKATKTGPKRWTF